MKTLPEGSQDVSDGLELDVVPRPHIYKQCAGRDPTDLKDPTFLKRVFEAATVEIVNKCFERSRRPQDVVVVDDKPLRTRGGSV